MENWKDIMGFEGSYQVSDLGRVKSLARMPDRATKPVNERILAPLEWGGYLSVRLSKENKSKNYKIHRLVALHFIDNPENKKEVNHLNGKSDNRVSSLEWVTHQENIKHAAKQGMFSGSKNKGVNNGMSKLNDDIVREIRRHSEYQKDLAGIYNVSESLIRLVINNKIWTHVS